MNKVQAHDILDRIRNTGGQGLSLAITNAALQATGDLPRLRPFERPLGEALCSDGDEPRLDWASKVVSQALGERDSRIGWSRYLDCKENQGIQR